MTSLQDKELPKEVSMAHKEKPKPPPPPSTDPPPAANGDNKNKPLDHSTQMTCDVLCSLSMSAAAAAAAQGGTGCPDDDDDGDNFCDGKMMSCGGIGEGAKLCPKQMLPMFLSSTLLQASDSVWFGRGSPLVCVCSIQKHIT
jgi:hypothetical protein